jgi:hypothetical protein
MTGYRAFAASVKWLPANPVRFQKSRLFNMKEPFSAIMDINPSYSFHRRFASDYKHVTSLKSVAMDSGCASQFKQVAEDSPEMPWRRWL